MGSRKVADSLELEEELGYDLEEPAVDAAAGPAPAPGVPPTREDMRERVRAALAEGRTTPDEILADMYASLYWTECQITGFVNAFASSRLGRKMISRAEKQARAEGFTPPGGGTEDGSSS